MQRKGDSPISLASRNAVRRVKAVTLKANSNTPKHSMKPGTMSPKPASVDWWKAEAESAESGQYVPRKSLAALLDEGVAVAAFCERHAGEVKSELISTAQSARILDLVAAIQAVQRSYLAARGPVDTKPVRERAKIIADRLVAMIRWYVGQRAERERTSPRSSCVVRIRARANRRWRSRSRRWLTRSRRTALGCGWVAWSTRGFCVRRTRLPMRCGCYGRPEID